ncbi:hypothetical protein V8F33_013738 [Rhypophila sp. PSN 637]
MQYHNLIDILLRRRTSESVIKRHCKTIFGDSVAEVEGIIRPVTDAETQLLACQRELDSKGISLASNLARAALERIGHVQQQVTDAQQQFTDLKQDLKGLINTQDTAMRLMNSMYLFMEERLRCRDIDLERFRLVLEATHDMDSRPGGNRNRQITVSVPITIPVTVCSDEQQSVPAEDLYSIRRKYHSFSNKALARAQYLLTMPRFMSWMVEPDSDLLLVDGHCKDQSIGRISPISVLCASLAETLMAAADNDQDTPLGSFANQPQIILFFFCGHHV